MRRKLSGRALPWILAALGAVALVLRMLLYGTAVDAKGLLLRMHPLEIGQAVVSVVALAVIILAVRRQVSSGRCEICPGGNLVASLGNLAAGAGILVTVLTAGTGMGNYLETVWRILGLVSPVCLLLAGFSRLLGRKPFFLLHVVACLFFVLHIVTRYQLWSGNPQLQDYVFSLLGAMALMFFSFYTAAWEADCGKPRMHLGMGLAAIYLCLTELARSFCPGLYLGGIVWVLAELSVLDICEEER